MAKYYWKCTADCPRHCTATSTDNANPWSCHYADCHDCKWAKVDKPTIEQRLTLIEAKIDFICACYCEPNKGKGVDNG